MKKQLFYYPIMHYGMLKTAKHQFAGNPEPEAKHTSGFAWSHKAGRMAQVATKHRPGLTASDFWPDLVNSSWRGGEGEAWERGPYFLDGLVPLAWLLDDEILKKKASSWIETILTGSSDTGWYGPAKNTDRWPLAVANKVLMQYYEATNDSRALEVLKNYFRSSPNTSRLA
jgi:hypothetical protein